MGLAIGEVHDLKSSRVFDEARNILRQQQFGADKNIDGRMLAVKQFCPVRVGCCPDAGDAGRDVIQRVGYLAGDHIDFIGAG